ncbi:MAG TPA: transcription antitermination factor NusB [Casimicrobiaceae bacterium]
MSKSSSRASSERGPANATSGGRASASRGGNRHATAHSPQGGQRGGRHRARELVLQGLYQWLLARTPPPAIRAQLADSPGFAKCDTALFDGLWQGVTSEFDTLIAAFAPYLDRVPDQLSPIEKSILAMGAWELLRAPETPYRVAINEAVELAKAYGGTDGHKYVNGVLDKLAAATRAAEVSAARAAG